MQLCHKLQALPTSPRAHVAYPVMLVTADSDMTRHNVTVLSSVRRSVALLRETKSTCAGRWLVIPR
jgi:hypothetical protein